MVKSAIRFFILILPDMTCIIPLELIELEAFNYHLAAPCKFMNGRDGLWIIDTGASRTVFDQGLTDCYEPVELDDEMVRSAGIGSEKLETTIGELQAFTLDNYMVEPMMVALIDLSHINSLYFHATEREICGLIGSDFLMMRKAVIDYSTLQLTLHIPAASEEMGANS